MGKDFVFPFEHTHPYPLCTCAGCEGARLGARLGKQLAKDFIRALKNSNLELVIRRRRKVKS